MGPWQKCLVQQAAAVHELSALYSEVAKVIPYPISLAGKCGHVLDTSGARLVSVM